MIQINFRDVLGSAFRSQMGSINTGIRSSGSQPSNNLSSLLSGFSGSSSRTSDRAENYLKNFFNGMFNTGGSRNADSSASLSSFYRDMRAAGRAFRQDDSSSGIRRSRIHMPTVATQQNTPRVRFTDAPNHYRFQAQTPTVASANTLPTTTPTTQPTSRTGMPIVTPQQQTPTVLSAQGGSPTLQLRPQGNPSQFSLPGQGLAT